eukprot:GHVT01100508.1.p1 GENE.GHVT01100508.1~~GHVT01100508.1.p1  ORF type:complete len:242 (+),score=53.34 GHVT01100508.1:576-1301(+)
MPKAKWGACGFVNPRSWKNQRHVRLAAPRRNPLVLPPINLLTPPPDVVTRKKGLPIFHTDRSLSDPFGAQQASGFRKFAGALGAKEPVLCRHEESFTKMLMSFRFELRGKFENDGICFRDQLCTLARALQLVGWAKCRARYATGLVQGNVTAASYFQRWLKFKDAQGAIVRSAHISDDNYGLAKTDFSFFYKIDDYRTETQKKLAELQRFLASRQRQMKDSALRQQRELRTFYDEHHLQNF